MQQHSSLRSPRAPRPPRLRRVGASARAGRDACNKASGLRAATAVGPIVFSDAIGRDAFLVRGTYPQRFMKGASGAMLCLVDRRTHKAEVEEAKGWSAHP